MAKIERKNLKIFAENAANNGQFGSAQNGTKITTQDPETVQALEAWGAGWSSAVIGGSKLPPLEELQSTTFVPTYHLAYLMQEGVAEWNSDTTYYMNSFVKDGPDLYYSLQDDNLNIPLSEAASWKIYSPVTLGDLSTVGDVRQSMLDPTAFQLLNGDTWVPMDGRDVTGSVYETITTSSNVPDATGVFFRSQGGNAGAVGAVQADATAQNGLTVQWGSANITTSSKTATWASANASTSSTSHYHQTFSNYKSGQYSDLSSSNSAMALQTQKAPNPVATADRAKTNNAGGGLTMNKNQWNSNQTAHSHTFNKNLLNSGQSWAQDVETRPLNMALYYYIKIN